MDNLKLTKRDMLLNWMLQKEIFRTSDVISWGQTFFSNRADRYKRDFVEEGLIIRLSEEEKEGLNYCTVEGIYCSRPYYFKLFPQKIQMELKI